MSSEQSVVARWNEVTLESVRAGSALPTVTTDQLFQVHAAIYDAWSAYDSSAYGLYSRPERPESEHTDANKAEAVSFAAYTMLVELFPDRKAEFDTFMDELGYDPDAESLSDAAMVGQSAAQGVMDARAGDGSNRENDYEDTTGYTPVNEADPDSSKAPGGEDFDPNHWQPLRVPTGTVVDDNGIPIATDDPASYVDQVPLGPGWGNVDTFALMDVSSVLPPAPPQLGDMSEYVDATGKVTTGDAAYREQFNAVLEASANLTEEQKVIAEFWADGPRTESPPGHWNQIAQDIAFREGHGIDEDAKMFLALNAAIFDAGIATWNAKYVYDFVRPQSAIRDMYFGEEIEAWGGPNQGTQTILGQEWQPYQNVTFVTPPFPEFTSGHSGFSMAAARTIASFVGSDAFFDGETLGVYDLDGVPGTDLLGQYVATELLFEEMTGGPVTLQWETLTEAAEEAGISRIFGGIHIQDGDLRGREIGEEVAGVAENLWRALFMNGGDDVLAASEGGGALYAGPGDDLADGVDVVDHIHGDTGNDTLRGNGGDDMILGGLGLDRLNGGDGDDTIIGGDEEGDLRDEIYAGAGNDLVHAGEGNDLAYGQDGNDTLLGEEGSDELIGQNGDDELGGGAGSDLLMGGAGDDFLNGGFANDRLNGGDGADTFFHTGASGHASDWIQDYAAADGDELQYGDATASAEDFIVQFSATDGAGDASVDEAFVVHQPSGQILWALVDGAAQDQIMLRIPGTADAFDLLA